MKYITSKIPYKFGTQLQYFHKFLNQVATGWLDN